jgi:hypothetical protein
MGKEKTQSLKQKLWSHPHVPRVALFGCRRAEAFAKAFEVVRHGKAVDVF